MAILDLNRENLEFHKGRVQSLGSDSKRLWGEMEPVRICLHLRKSIEISLGDIEVKPIVPGFLGPILKFAFFEVFTKWPKARLKSPPEFTPETDKSFEEEQQLLLDSMDRFVNELEADPDRKTVSPLLGAQPISYWSHVHGVHNNHHYRQYGLV